MILYTPFPNEVTNCNPEGGEPKFAEFEFCGGRMVVQPVGHTSFKISRIISTDPQIYLDPRLQPGAIINLAEDKYADLGLEF